LEKLWAIDTKASLEFEFLRSAGNQSSIDENLKMKYEAEIDGQTINLELEEKPGRLAIVIEERLYDVEVVRPEPGVYQLFIGDKVYEARVSSSDNNSLKVNLRGKLFNVNIIDRKHRRSGAEHGDESQKQLVAPMPGKVVRVLLKAGDEVLAGQGVVIVEAMKMQNEIKSSKAGRLSEIRVAEGDAVSANQILAMVE
jgi:biotin carboxyl carrier protein